jgi:hypothetical protein
VQRHAGSSIRRQLEAIAIFVPFLDDGADRLLRVDAAEIHDYLAHVHDLVATQDTELEVIEEEQFHVIPSRSVLTRWG